MTVIAPSDHTSIMIPTERGGCGRQHEKDGDRLTVDCDLCEPVILNELRRHGWATTLSGVALTPDEIGEVESAERQAERQKNRTWGDPAVFAAALKDALGTSTATVEAPSLFQQIAALSPQERITLAEMMMAGAAPSNEAVGAGTTATLQPGAQPTNGDDGGDDEPVAAQAPKDEPPAKRGPGRPRSTSR
jgi:hypothetical protein